MRFNDGFIDPEGRYFAGAMSDPKVNEPTNEGVLFRLDPDLSLHRMIENVTIPNGMGFTLDKNSFYFIDSPTKSVWKFRYDRKTGNISDREVFYRVEGNGVPDGMAMDVTECIWVALCGGSKVLKISPGGKLVGEICLPTRMISCPAFAGEDLCITVSDLRNIVIFPVPSSEPETWLGSMFALFVSCNPGTSLRRYSNCGMPLVGGRGRP